MWSIHHEDNVNGNVLVILLLHIIQTIKTCNTKKTNLVLFITHPMFIYDHENIYISLELNEYSDFLITDIERNRN